ncbi:MAG: PAS domain S-box protein [Caldilineaceae bacterium]|nr:PAS domain S-box protein [Caldilineaceae bacterium]
MDLTHQKYDETHLAYLESAPIGVVVVEENGQIERINARAEEIFGYSRQEIIGRPVETLLPRRFRHIHHMHRGDYFETPRSRPMGLGLELSGVRKDGTEFPLEVGLSHAEVGGRRLALAFVTDITVRVQAAEALRRHAGELEQRVAERTREIERRRQVAEGLHDILTILNTARPLEEILDYIVEQAHRLLVTDAVAIYRQNEKGGAPQVVAARQLDEVPPGRDLSPMLPTTGGRSSREDRVMPLAEAIEDESGGMTRSGRYRSVLAVPLNVKGEVYGSICLYYRSPRSFSLEERELAVAFADQAALAIENARLREQVERSAVAAERNRLARDLHDAVTQTLFSTSLIAEVLPRIWHRNQDEGERRLSELRELTRGALAEMRALLLELRPSALVDSNLTDLLQQLAEAVTGRARLPVSVSVEGEGSLPAETKVAFYRIAQEALNNVAKHSHAAQSKVALIYRDHEVRLIVQDDGRGFDVQKAPTSHLGLGIMRERAEAVGSKLTIISKAGEGTRVEVVWALH